ncbi:uncharacterized protein LOC131597970 [Vicia villosa]|uniref:uncharacterized protein LOC131597970 n=1 Tax=Vicia villosa TaxID=3911 RepID=UPI00273B857F|nr:uncharacterized protein LOC131597970 [Vicia villosa]
MREIAQQHLTTWNSMKTQSKFQMSRVYMAMCEGGEAVEWRFLFNQNIARPRAQFVTWLVCHGKQATKDRLVRFKMIDDSVCSTCRKAYESREHCFFECESNAEIWQKVLNWMNYNHQPLKWQEELKWVLNASSKKGTKAKLLKMAFTEAVYGIWKRRNDKVFKHTSYTDCVQDIIDCILYRCWNYIKLRNYIGQLLL